MELQDRAESRVWIWIRTLAILVVTLYAFLVAINLLGHSFQLFGEDFAVALLHTTENPFFGLFLGMLATSLIQSSSTTTSIIVGLVAAGGLSLSSAIPVIMGANVGTTVTNTLVSFGHATRRVEFRRALSAAIVHDVFNLLSVAVIFPLEVLFHPIERAAVALQAAFSDIGGMELFDPVGLIVSPAIEALDAVFGGFVFKPIALMLLSLGMLFLSLMVLVRTMRSAVVQRAEKVIDKYLFGRDYATFLAGVMLTLLVQSSSVSTSLIVPLAGAGLLTLREIFPFTMGANIGTTMTAIVAALGTGNPIAVTVSFSHLIFNTFGILIFYPLRSIPIGIARRVGHFAGASMRNVIIVITIFVLLYLVPLAIFLVTN